MDYKWEEKSIGEIADVIGGGTPKTSNPEFWEGNIPWITPKDLSTHQERYIARGVRNISELGLNNSSARILPKNSVLLSSRAPIGYLAIAKNPVTTNQGFKSLVLKEGYIPEFYYYFLKINIDLLEGHANGSTFKEISGSTLKNIKVPVPPLPEQKAVARILSSLDDKIELNQQMNRTLEAQARAIFKSWFVDFDPVRAKMEGRQPAGMDAATAALFPDAFEESALGLIPKGWEISTIGESVRVVGGSTPSTKNPDYWQGGHIHWVSPKVLSSLSSPVLLDAESKITDLGLKQISSGLLPKGSLLLSSRAPIGYLAISEIPVAINQGFIAMICNHVISNHYMLYWVNENMGEIYSRANGSTFLEISKSNFRPINILIPPREIINIFTNKAEILYQKIVNGLEESNSLSKLRDFLLPKLMSGEIRVKEAEKMVA